MRSAKRESSRFNVLREEVGLPESTIFGDGILHCGGKEVDTHRWIQSLQEIGMRVSRPITKFMDFTFEQIEKGNLEPLQIGPTRGRTRKSYSLQIPRYEYRNGMRYGNGDHKAGRNRMDKRE